MKLFEWSEEKDAILREKRGISFEDIERVVHTGGLLADTPHPNRKKYPHQRMLAVRIGAQVYGVPCAQKDEKTYFLKTAYPSRKYARRFLKAN
ncbi:DUF4258 domain-containing protein [Candidatus Kaiserbacteria bacterium]|nr:DUF4258 domain-containing protein [Candidatus Kaiserbacteria bacterium]